ncbi:MAG: hypothetical protein JWO85_581, partial [Candidatus Eremiobacteraeota bacterium]|nr:hypothetical protein [Candidatus Eremiobacteraeota bacterium]
MQNDVLEKPAEGLFANAAAAT